MTVLVHFRGQFTPGKSKIMPKNNIFPETTSLALSNYTSPRSHVNQRILIKSIKKKQVFGPKMGLNCPLGPAQRVNTASHIAYHGTIYPQFIYPQILNPGCLPFSTSPGRYPSFLWVPVPIGLNFRGLGAINPVNNIR